MPKPYPREFRDDVVRVDPNRDRGVRLVQVANACDFLNWGTAKGRFGFRGFPISYFRITIKRCGIPSIIFQARL